MPVVAGRDYSLIGTDARLAGERGLVHASWYRCDIPRPRMRELSRRRDGPAIRDTLLWFGLLILTAALGYLGWGKWWAVPPFIAYGVLYGSASDSRWHECGHRTAFKTTWLNDWVYEIASFMVLRESAPWRRSHARHHSETAIVGRDPEITVGRPPPNLLVVALELFRLKSGLNELYHILLHCLGKITPEEATYIPDSEHRKVHRNARIYFTIYTSVIVGAIVSHSILPLMYVGLPSFYGGWLGGLFGLTQHAGLAEDVLDHRLNSRTVYMNPVFRYLYWEMNFHVEHHMFPMVPFHRLKELHEDLKSDMPKPYRGLWEAYREIIPTFIRQTKDPSYCVERQLPSNALPRIQRQKPDTLRKAGALHDP